LADFSDSIETVFFSKIYHRFRELIQPDVCVAIKGRISIKNGDQTIVVDAIKNLQADTATNDNYPSSSQPQTN